MRIPHSDETKRKMSEIAKINQNKPEVKERQHIARNKPGVKERWIEAIKRAINTPEFKEKHRAATKKAMNNPEIKERHRMALNRSETKERMSISAKKAHGRSEVKEKSRIALNKPEVKARRIEVQKEAQNRPDVKAKKSVSVKASWDNPEVRERHCIAAIEFSNRPETKERRKETYVGGFWYGSVVDDERKRYCERWNPNLWRRIDAAQGYKSILSGKTRENNGDRALSRHHIYWQEKACCEWDEDVKGYYAMINIGTRGKPNMYKHYINGNPNKFVLLTREEHGIIAGSKKLGTTKLTWIKVLEDLIETKLGGKCYYTKEEFKKFNLS